MAPSNSNQAPGNSNSAPSPTNGNGTSGNNSNTNYGNTGQNNSILGSGAGTGGAPGTANGGGGASGTSFQMPAQTLPNVEEAALPSIIAAFVTSSGEDGAGTDSVPNTANTAKDSSALSARDISSKPDATTGTGTGGPTVIIGQRNTYAARLSASQYIDIFGYYPAERDVQHAIRDFYNLDLVRIENETALTAKSTLFNVLLAQNQVSVEQEQVAYATENVRITTARRQQGIAADYDVLTAQTALANSQQVLIAAQNQLQLANSQLSYLIGVDPDRTVTVITPDLPAVDQQIDLNQSIDAAYYRRPELAQANRNVTIASRLVKIAGATLSPTLGLVGVAESNSLATTITPKNLLAASVQLGIPLDDGGATRSRVRSARVDLQTQTLNRDSLKLSVALEVRQATINVRNAQASIGSAQFGERQGEEAVRLANVRYQNGLGTFLDVTNALAQLATARSNLANAQYAYETSLAQLLRNEGGR